MLLISFGYRLDGANIKLKRIKANEFLRNFFVFENKMEKSEFLLWGIIIQIIAYFFILSSLVTFLLTFILKNGDYNFVFVLYMYVIIATVTIINITEMLSDFIKEMITDWRNKE
jgi:uncharacterized membrane protein YhaH (DUF805 family)